MEKEYTTPNPPIKNILKKLHTIQGEIEKMEKDGHNDHNNYNYLSETQLTMKMKELFDKHEIMTFYSWYRKDLQPTPSGKQLVANVQVDYRFYDVESGEFISGTVSGDGADASDKGIFKAITGAIKYLYMKTFNIPTGDDPEKTTKEEVTIDDVAPPPIEENSYEEAVQQPGTVQNLAQNYQGDKVEGVVCKECGKGKYIRSQKGNLYCSEKCWLN